MVLEICPTSNVRTGAVRDEEQMAEIVFGLQAAGVPLVVATDGPEMIGTRLRAEYAMLVRLGALCAEAARQANDRGHEVSFIPPSTTARSGGGTGRILIATWRAPSGARRRRWPPAPGGRSPAAAPGCRRCR